MSANAISVDKVATRKRSECNGGKIVPSEPANSKTYMESVMSFVKGLSQAYSNTAPVDEKEPIVWARYFSYADAYGYESSEQDSASFYLVLGYVNGVQMWFMSANGEAQEMFSLRDGPVKTACLLPPPPPSVKADSLQTKRPLLAICLATDSKQIFACVSILSLRNGEQVKKIQYNSDVVSLQAGPAPVLLVALKDSIHAYDVRSLDEVFIVNGCYCGSGGVLNPVTLGSRWLVYSPSVHFSGVLSLGGATGEGSQSYVTSVLNAAKTISKGLSTVGDTVNWLATKSRLTSSGDKTMSMTSNERSWASQRPSSGGPTDADEDRTASGLVTVLDVLKILDVVDENENDRAVALEIECEPLKQFVIAHFVAHVDQPLSCFRLSSSGNLLATADALGHAFHVFSIFPHPSGPTFAAIHHLYTLWRGTTPAQVQELCFSWDSRWLIASTLRGTCHIFPISPYGGTPNVRTHTSSRLVNRTSTFQKSAGLNEMDYYEPHPSPSRRPPSENSTLTSQGVLSWQTQHRATAPRPFTLNPRHPPFPPPVSLHAVGHIRLGPSPSASIPGVLPPQNAFGTSSSTDATATPLSRPTDVVIATRFLQTARAEKTGATQPGSSKRLLIISSNGYLTEYLLEPRPQSDNGKISDQSPVVATASEKVCWPLQRQLTWSTLPLPLHFRNPLIVADDGWRCRYEMLRPVREKYEVKDRSTSLTVSEEFPSLDSGKSLSNVQSKSTDKGKSRRETGGGSRTGGKRGKSNAWNSEPAYQAPTSVEMQRNGSWQADDHRASPTAINSHTPIATATPTGQDSTRASEEWLSQVEMVTHEGPARRLWMGPQFHFKRYLSTGSTLVLSPVSSALLSNQHLHDPYSGNGSIHDGFGNDHFYEEELDVTSLNIHPIRSDPVPTPTSRFNERVGDNNDGSNNSISIEAGSGNFDRAAKMLEITNGSMDERRPIKQDALVDKIADAMLDFHRTIEAEGKFTPSSSPKRKPVNHIKSDMAEFASTESFDFSTFDPTSLHAPDDSF